MEKMIDKQMMLIAFVAHRVTAARRRERNERAHRWD